jgi:hypothetical protein
VDWQVGDIIVIASTDPCNTSLCASSGALLHNEFRSIYGIAAAPGKFLIFHFILFRFFSSSIFIISFNFVLHLIDAF